MNTILQGDWIDRLKELEAESVQCCVTSPPYWGFRDYGMAGQLGLEKTPEEYVSKLVAGFEDVRRVLCKDGTLWLNLGDSYGGAGRGQGGNGIHSTKQTTNRGSYFDSNSLGTRSVRKDGCKAKDLVGIPWMVAFALRAAGWYLRSDIIWSKPNPMPESVTDRPTKAHEYIFLLTKSARYYYDAESIKEEATTMDIRRPFAPGQVDYRGNGHDRRRENPNRNDLGASNVGGFERLDRNKRSVWTVPPASHSEAHFATFPPDLIKPCILAGSKSGDTILDPFGGSGTTAQVALELGRKAISIELNPEYVKLIEQRTNVTYGLAL